MDISETWFSQAAHGLQEESLYMSTNTMKKMLQVKTDCVALRTRSLKVWPKDTLKNELPDLQKYKGPTTVDSHAEHTLPKTVHENV